MTTEITDTDRVLLRALAREVLASRVERLCEVGVTNKGRVIGVLVGEATAAEVKWEAIMAASLPAPRTL